MGNSVASDHVCVTIQHSLLTCFTLLLDLQKSSMLPTTVSPNSANKHLIGKEQI
jgi:hypothetical protein